MSIAKNTPSPLWGGLGWGSLWLRRNEMNAILKNFPTPTPALPTSGRGKKSGQHTEKLIRLVFTGLVVQ